MRRKNKTLVVRKLDYQALVRDRQESRDRDETLLRSGQVDPLELQARNSLLFPHGEVEIVSLAAYCLEDDAPDAGEF